MNYAKNNNKEIRLNHLSNIFNLASSDFYKFRFFIKFLINFKKDDDNFIMINNFN